MRTESWIPFVLVVLAVLVIVLLAWGVWQFRCCRDNMVDLSTRDDVLLVGLLVLAAFAMGIFLAYTLFDLI